MPTSNCPECGEELKITKDYYGEIGCPECGTALTVEDEFREGWWILPKSTLFRGKRIERKYPSMTTVDQELGDWLTEPEYQFISESAKCIGIGAYTAAEQSMAKALEGVLRRVYDEDAMLGTLVERMGEDENLNQLSGVIEYFREVRNRTSHPERPSDEHEAKSTFSMIQRLLIEISQVYPNP